MKFLLHLQKDYSKEQFAGVCNSVEGIQWMQWYSWQIVVAVDGVFTTTVIVQVVLFVVAEYTMKESMKSVFIGALVVVIWVSALLQ